MMRSRSIHTQLGLTLIVAVALVLGIHSMVVIVMPPPPPQLQSLQQTASALRDPTQASRFGLRSEWHDVLPDAMENNFVSDALAQLLAVDPDRVRIAWRGAQRTLSIQRIGANPPASETRLSQALMLIPAIPAFAAALQEADGARWMVVAPPQPWLTAWQRQVVISFLLSALLLVPFAWLAASRLTRPLRELSQVAQRLELSSKPEHIPLRGPREAQQLAQALRAAVERWRQQSAERIQLIAAIAHDLRSPLTGLRLRLDPLPEAEREPLLADLTRMEQMVTRALEYVRSDQDALQLEPVDLVVLAQDCVSSACASGLRVSWGGASQASIVLHADALALHRALANVIENAARYAGGGEVAVSVEGAMACVEVSDRGPGIAEDRVAELLQPFQRGDRSRRAGGGFGLGLSIASTIARRHTGELKLSGRTGGGLIVELRIPLHLPMPP